MNNTTLNTNENTILNTNENTNLNTNENTSLNANENTNLNNPLNNPFYASLNNSLSNPLYATHYAPLNFYLNSSLFSSLNSSINHSSLNLPLFPYQHFSLLQAFASYFANLLISSKLILPFDILHLLQFSFSSHSLLLFHSNFNYFFSLFFTLAGKPTVSPATPSLTEEGLNQPNCENKNEENKNETVEVNNKKTPKIPKEKKEKATKIPKEKKEKAPKIPKAKKGQMPDNNTIQEIPTEIKLNAEEIEQVITNKNETNEVNNNDTNEVNNTLFPYTTLFRSRKSVV